MTLPVCNGENNITIPLAYKLHDKSCTKIELAKELINNAMPMLSDYKVVILCDSWYTNGPLLELVEKHDNLELIGAVKNNTVLRST